MSEDKPKFHFEEDNTEGKHETAFRIDNSELKKGEFAVATHLADLYDCDVVTTPPVHGDVLKFDGVIEKWVPGEAKGCNLIAGTLNLHVQYYLDIDDGSGSGEGSSSGGSSGSSGYEESINPKDRRYDYSNPNDYHVDNKLNNKKDPSYAIGTYENPFNNIQDALDWIHNNCASIADGAKINILVFSVNSEIRLYLSYDYDDERFFVEWNPAKITSQDASKIFIYGYDWDETEEKMVIPTDNDLWWKTYRNMLPIRFMTDLEGICDRYGSSCDCAVWWNALNAFEPFIKVSGTTLGGLYNFKFAYPDVEIDCYETQPDGSDYGSGWGAP